MAGAKKSAPTEAMRASSARCIHPITQTAQEPCAFTMSVSPPTPMNIRTRMCISLDGYVTTADGLPVQLADPAFVPGKSYGFPEFQKSCDAVLMGRTTFEPALSADRWPWPNLDVFVL